MISYEIVSCEKEILRLWLCFNVQISKYTVPVKSLDTTTHSRGFLYFYEITHMESCSNQKRVKQIKLHFIF